MPSQRPIHKLSIYTQLNGSGNSSWPSSTERSKPWKRTPLSVLGHPPLGTDDRDIYRYSADAETFIGIVADLDLGRRELRVISFKVKGGPNGRH